MKLMPVLDLAACFVIMLHVAFSMFSTATVFYFAVYLIIKGLIFSLSKDFASMVDLFCGFYVAFLLLAGISFGLINVLIIVWLLQKGLFGIIG